MANVIKKYYTLERLSKVYDVYAPAVAEKNRVYKNVKIYPLGFQSLEEANALQSGKWNSYLTEHVVPFETEADAVIYADGSLDEDLFEGAYGIVVFFKDGDVFYESAWLKDQVAEKYDIVRYSSKGDVERLEKEYKDIFRDKGTEKKEHGFISASRNIGSECESVMRGIDVCLEKGYKKLVVAYDCEIVETVWNNRNTKTNVTRKYAEYCDKIEKMGVCIEWIKVDSHGSKKQKPQYLLDNPIYVHAVYNDIVDAMAKAETATKPIGNAENFNLARAILPKPLLSFNDKGLKTSEDRRAYARELLKNVLDINILRPRFK